MALEDLARTVAQAADDPRAALQRAMADAAAVATDPARRFWNQLAQARLLVLLEQASDADKALQQVRQAQAAWPDGGRLPELALELQELHLATLTQDNQQLRPRVLALLTRIRATAQPRLVCDAVALYAFVLAEGVETAQAWQAAEEGGACARALGDVELQASAMLHMGMVASKATGRGDTKTPAQHFQRALQVLDERPARYLRSVIEWEIGKAQDDVTTKLHHFERARDYSRQIGDEVGVAIADTDIGRLMLLLERPHEALRLARRAREVLLRRGVDRRVMATYSNSIGALAKMSSRDVLPEIDAARRWELPTTAVGARAYLAREMARGYAAVGEYRQAYEEQARSDQLAAQARKESSNREVLQLQARFDAAQREAENTHLRLRDESAGLQLEAARARQQTLWVALTALAAALSAAAFVAARMLRERRQMADLALRDELTGAPNRRAVTAIAQTQWGHCRRLRIKLSLAIFDLDHFKRVNDTYGHAVGDAALRAFATACAQALRAQDRVGRWGGEEWLLVAPGADAPELEAIFRRIRQRFEQTAIEGMPFPHGMTFSMGGARYVEGEHADLHAVIHHADQRLYRAKAEGRDRVCVAD